MGAVAVDIVVLNGSGVGVAVDMAVASNVGVGNSVGVTVEMGGGVPGREVFVLPASPIKTNPAQ